jgi:hypothetical protein
MSGHGLDPGNSLGAVAHCSVADDHESLAANAASGVLPAAVILDNNALSLALETAVPLSPFGVGGPWPPEAQVGPLEGARRLPLALALATLERPAGAQRDDARDLMWSWPRVGRFDDEEPGQEHLAALVRRTIGRFAETKSAPLALAVPNGLPLIEQTMLLGRLGRSVRLIWRCMAAGLYRSLLQARDGASNRGVSLGPEAKVVHVHLGMDGFEATRFMYARHQGAQGPALLVPRRSRPRIGLNVSVANPFLGLQLCAHAHWSHSNDVDQLWSSMFAAPAPLKIPKASLSRVRLPSIFREDRRAGWPRVLEGAVQSRQQVEAAVARWAGEVAALVNHDSEGKPHVILTTGDFAHIADDGQIDDLLSLPARMIAELARGAHVPFERLESAAIAKGAALYASRRARQWATYLDELPPVEIVVQSQGGARWEHLLKQPHYDAGTPVEIKLDHFSLNAGERQILLPVYVHEFGEDTPDVLATNVEFKHSTPARTAAEVVVEVEAATGLPVVRATVHGDLNETAEVDWVNDRASACTGMTKTGYLDSLPRAFPPIEPRVAGDWWVTGGRFKTVRVPELEIFECTGEQLSERLPRLYVGVESRFLAAVGAFLRLARKREWSQELASWVAATDAEGRNATSAEIASAASTLHKAVFREWSEPKISDRAGKALAALCWNEPSWVQHLLSGSGQLRDVGEHHYLIAGLGMCVSEDREMALAISALADRLHVNMRAAALRGSNPRGIGTLMAIGNLLSLRGDAMKCVSDDAANQLAHDVSQFVARTISSGGFKNKFQALLRTLVYLTRRRAYQSSFLSPESQAFRDSVRSCVRVYIATRANMDLRLTEQPTERELVQYKRELKMGSAREGSKGQAALEATAAVIDSIALPEVIFNRTRFPKRPAKLIQLLVQVVEYIEGRGTGLLVIDEDDEQSDDEDE